MRAENIRIHCGSYVSIRSNRLLDGPRDLTICCWVYPTLRKMTAQTLLSRWSDASGRGFALYLAPEGDAALRIGDGSTKPAVVRTGKPLALRRWHFVIARFDAKSGTARVMQCQSDPWPSGGEPVTAETKTGSTTPADTRLALLIAASHAGTDERPESLDDFFNGKIDSPALFSRSLSDEEADRLRVGGDPCDIGGLCAAWDFSVDISGAEIRDRSGNGMNGSAVNLPMRAVTGRNWTGEENDFRRAPEQYGAIHFHDDDLDDAGWPEAFSLRISPQWRSGVYAVRLKTDDFEDYVPFIVRPARGQASAKAALLMPSLTYMTYVNDHMPTEPGLLLSVRGITLDQFLAEDATAYEAAVFRYMVDNRLHSMYDLHSDGSPVCYGSRLRPLTNIRPRYNKPNIRFRNPHLLSCDLYIVDWLDEKGISYDTIDDESLHAEGLELLSHYNVVMTGTHPEYWTLEMLRALKAYMTCGGRVMYLGGNGFYWVTSFDAARPHVVEIRRGYAGLRTWTSEPGECHHSTTGELGGLWRYRGIPPQSLVGVGFASACGLEPARPYRRTKASYDPKHAFIFAGIGDEVIGDFGIHMGGAAGWELDIVDPLLGTPPNTVVLASSFGHSDAYQRTIEELQAGEAGHGGSQDPHVRADLTYFEGPNGAAVFSVGSISWCGSLSHDNYQNNISRVTENVLRAFIAREGGIGDRRKGR